MNKARTEEIIKQIKNTADPESLKEIIAEHTKSVSKLASSVSETQKEILSNIIPILTLPSPTPTSIVSWLGKLTTGIAMPQMKAQIKLTKQLAELSSAIAEVSAAVAEAKAELNEVIGPLKEVADEVQGAIDSALETVGATQDLLNELTGETLSSFDTSSITNFLQSADQQVQQLQDKATQFIAS